jgi:hypothetical protein
VAQKIQTLEIQTHEIHESRRPENSGILYGRDDGALGRRKDDEHV